MFHDDQHGTAVVTLAAVENALRITGKRMEDLTIVISGVGAAGVAIGKIGAAVECIISTRGKSREAIFTELLTQAKTQAVAAGANADTLAVISQSDTPLAYMTDESHHFRVRVSGELR